MEITLSDGNICQVRQLAIFELDSAIEPNDTKPFIYTIQIGGNTIEKVYDLDAWEEPPEPTELSEQRTIEGSVEWWKWYEYEIYHGAIYHKQKLEEDFERYCNDVKEYILSTCISPSDRIRITTYDDFTALYYSALVPQLDFNDLELSLSRTFRATFDNKGVLTKLFEDSDSEDFEGAKYNVIRTWEIQAINLSGLSELDWSNLPIDERARRVVAMKIDDWMQALTMKKNQKEKLHG